MKHQDTPGTHFLEHLADVLETALTYRYVVLYKFFSSIIFLTIQAPYLRSATYPRRKLKRALGYWLHPCWASVHSGSNPPAFNGWAEKRSGGWSCTKGFASHHHTCTEGGAQGEAAQVYGCHVGTFSRDPPSPRASRHHQPKPSGDPHLSTSPRSTKRSPDGTRAFCAKQQTSVICQPRGRLNRSWCVVGVKAQTESTLIRVRPPASSSLVNTWKETREKQIIL